jgi:hypothetical protein
VLAQERLGRAARLGQGIRAEAQLAALGKG